VLHRDAERWTSVLVRLRSWRYSRYLQTDWLHVTSLSHFHVALRVMQFRRRRRQMLQPSINVALFQLSLQNLYAHTGVIILQTRTVSCIIYIWRFTTNRSTISQTNLEAAETPSYYTKNGYKAGIVLFLGQWSAKKPHSPKFWNKCRGCIM